MNLCHASTSESRQIFDKRCYTRMRILFVHSLSRRVPVPGRLVPIAGVVRFS